MTTRILLLFMSLLVAGACKSNTGPDATYATRGVVQAVGAKLDIHHEAMPDYKARDGKQVGMASMTMSFAVAKDVSLANVVPGAKVAITFDVRWNADPGLEITSLSLLPPETALELSEM